MGDYPSFFDPMKTLDEYLAEIDYRWKFNSRSMSAVCEKCLHLILTEEDKNGGGCECGNVLDWFEVCRILGAPMIAPVRTITNLDVTRLQASQ